MKVRYWGVRGSVPTPLSGHEVKAKISSVLQRVRVQDLETPETREVFLSKLPPELYGHIGGNTTCVEIVTDTNDVIVIDGGTGIRDLGVHYDRTRTPRTYHILLTHFHWDHLQGLPFFPAFFRPENKIRFYSPVAGFELFLREQMKEPYFPVPMSIFPAQVEFVELKTTNFKIGAYDIHWRFVNHPGSCVSYRFDHNRKSLVFSTDTELKVSDFVKTEENVNFYQNVDVLILDAQYTLDEAFEKTDWGHTSYSLGVDFALEYSVKTLYLFHHEPAYSDQKIEEIGRLAQWYADHKKKNALKVLIAREGKIEFVP